MQVRTPVTVLGPIKCHKCSFAAPAFPIVSFCLEVEVVDRSGEKLQNSELECVFGENFLQEEFCSVCCPVVCTATAHTIAGLTEKNKPKPFTLSFLSLQGRRLETWAEVDELFSVDTTRVQIVSNHYFPQCSTELCLLVQKYLWKKRATPAPLCFPCTHSQAVLCAPAPPWIYRLGWKWRNFSKYFSSFRKSNKVAACCQMLASVSGTKNAFSIWEVRIDYPSWDWQGLLIIVVSWQATQNVSKASRAGNWSTQSWGILNPAVGFLLFCFVLLCVGEQVVWS